MSPPSASRKRRYRQRSALAAEFNIAGRFSEWAPSVQGAVDALLEARDASKYASRHSGPEVRSRTSNTAARRARELEALLVRGRPASGPLIDQLSDKEFFDLSRRELLGDRDAIEEAERLRADDPEAYLRRVLAGPGWRELAPELVGKSRPTRGAPLPESGNDGDGHAEQEETEDPDPIDFAVLEAHAAPPDPAPIAKRPKPWEPADPRAWRSKKGRGFVDIDIF